MINEWNEFYQYTHFPVYAVKRKKDLSYLGGFLYSMLDDLTGFTRVFTILARGFLFHNPETGEPLSGDPYARVDYARRALLAWCSIPDPEPGNENPLKVYAPRREGQFDITNPEEAFEEDQLYSPSVLFNVKQAKYDKSYIITSIAFARRLFGQQGMLSSLELRLKPGSNFDAVKSEIQRLGGSQFIVRDRFEQQDDTFKIMKIEKFIAYIFLTFILMVACFNIIGSLSMLIIDKKDDVVTLRNLGASDRQIIRIFLFEGRLISAIGAVIGILLGLLICWLQQQYGLVGLGSTTGNFVIDAYPVSVHPEDILLIFITVLIVGFLAVWYPVRYFARRLLA